MPKEAKNLADVLAGTLKMGMRLKLGKSMPQIDAEGVDWIIGMVSEFSGQLIPSLSWDQKMLIVDHLYNFAHELEVALISELDHEKNGGGGNGLSNLAQ